MHQSLTGHQLVEGALMWTVAICYFTGIILMARQKHHIDPTKLCDPSNVKRFTKNVTCPPVDLLTASGRVWRKRIYILWGIGSAAFLILVISAI